MKIVLLKDVASLGKARDIKDVSDGYAKNLLIPQGLVAVATSKLLSRVEIEKREIEKKKQKEISGLKELAEKLNSLEIKISLKAGDDGKSFGSVTSTKLISAFKKEGFDIDKSQIEMKENIKTLGLHNVKLNLGYGIESVIKVIVESEKIEK